MVRHALGQPSNGEIELRPGDASLHGEASASAPKKAEEIIKNLITNKAKRERIENMNVAQYKNLWDAVKLERWEDVRTHVRIDNHPHSLISTPITEFFETILHVLVKRKNANSLVKELVEKIDERSLEKGDYRENTALSVAASAGNVEAAVLMAEKYPKLLVKFNCRMESPFHLAAMHGQEKIFHDLLSVAETGLEERDIQRLFSGKIGAKIVKSLLSANLYGLTLHILKKYKNLGRDDCKHRKMVLQELAERPLAFESGCNFGPLERFIYKGNFVMRKSSIPPKRDDCLRINISDFHEDRINPTNHDGTNSSKDNFFQICIRKTVSKLCSNFPPLCVREIYETKLKNDQAREIVQLLCNGVDWTFDNAINALKEPVLKAASLGIAEIVEEILNVYPAATMFYDEGNRTILQLAVLHRRDKVFNLFVKRCLYQKWMPMFRMKEDKENILHLAGRHVPSRHVNGAALRMQLETQWFKAVEKVVHPLLLEERNSKNKTPREVFEDDHKTLIDEGEKWMRDTASSCMIVDALIIAMVFAAIIAVPGNNEKGIPNFRNQTVFKVFIGADAAALFSSSFSLLLFVTILTSRYAIEDFLKELPMRLFLGLLTLIVSVAATLVASSSALIMLIDAVPGPKVIVTRSTLIPVIISAALPFLFFIWSQIRLLVDLFLSTSRPPVSFDKADDDHYAISASHVLKS